MSSAAVTATIPEHRRRPAGTNEALLRSAAAGDAAAWSAIVEQHQGMLWSIARTFRLPAADAGDAVQVTWLRLVENLDRIADPACLAAWLATTLRRECLRLVRSAQRMRVGVDVETLDIPAPGPDPLTVRLLTDERNQALWRALASLRQRDQQLLRMLMATPPPSYATVSQALGMPVGSIGPARRRALDLLREAALAQQLSACDGAALTAC